MKYIAFIVVLMLSFMADVVAQNRQHSVIITEGIIVDGDTLPHVRISEVRCMARRAFKTRRAQERYTKLVRNVRKALPYARMAAVRLKAIEDTLNTFSRSKERDEYMKKAEKQLFAEFEKPLKHLTVSQGRILIKLIDRETGNTSFELIKSLRGRFSAFLWQGVARLFGSNLKSEYDAEGDDKAIEHIVHAIDSGAYDDIPL